MATTVADQVVQRVDALVRTGQASTAAEAIRAVATEMDRSVSATSSAYYAGRRAAREDEQAAAATPGRAPRAARGSRARSSDARLFAEMLPLVEAGGTIEQAARRFGDDDEADAIAAGFTRWLLAERERTDGPAADDLAESRRRIAALEGEVRGLRRDLTRAHRALGRVRLVADDALGDVVP